MAWLLAAKRLLAEAACSLAPKLKIKETSDQKKVFLYSTHDTVLGNILNGLLGEFKEQTNYGSGLLFELRSLPTSDSPLVYMYFANVTDNGNIYPLPLNGSPTFSARCPETFCSLDGFTASLEEALIPVDIERECGAK